jgi:hypothetical protein
MTPLGSLALDLIEQLRACTSGWRFTPLVINEDYILYSGGLLPHVPAPANVSPTNHYAAHAPQKMNTVIRIDRPQRLPRFLKLSLNEPNVSNRHRRDPLFNATQPLLYISYYYGNGWYAPEDANKYFNRHRFRFGKEYPDNVVGYETYIIYSISRVKRVSKRKKIFHCYDVWNITQPEAPVDIIVATLAKSWENKRERINFRADELLVDFDRANRYNTDRYR